MNSTLLRLEAMDAQRFDLSKRRVSVRNDLGSFLFWHQFFQKPSTLVISTVAPSVHPEESGIPQINILSPESSPSDETATTNQSSSATDESTPSSLTAIEATIFSHKNDTQSTDVFEREDYTTTRTIIRPKSPRSPLLSVFSRPSSPAPVGTSRPSSPLGARLPNLTCMGSTDAFEEELDYILRQRENDLAGVSQDLQVKVTQDQAVFYEEKWRDAIQALLYQHTPPIVSCVGHVHSYWGW